MVDQEVRQKALDESPGTGDIIVDRWGSGALLPEHRKIVQARPRGSALISVDTDTSENVNALPPWYWNPSNRMARMPPQSCSLDTMFSIRTALQKIDPKLDITFNPVARVWQIWYHKPGFLKEADWTGGWVFCKELDESKGTSYIIKMVREMDQQRKVGLKQNYQNVKDRRERIRTANRAAQNDEVRERAGAVYDHMNPSVSGFGKSAGNKTSKFG